MTRSGRRGAPRAWRLAVHAPEGARFLGRKGEWWGPMNWRDGEVFDVRAGRHVGDGSRGLIELPSCVGASRFRNAGVAPSRWLVPLVKDAVRRRRGRPRSASRWTSLSLGLEEQRGPAAGPPALSQSRLRTMNVDVFTRCFPEWFDWFSPSQAPNVSKRAGRGNEPRVHQLPRSHGAQRPARSTTMPFGAEPGWCCAFDVVDPARCGAHYGVDPVSLRERRAGDFRAQRRRGGCSTNQASSTSSQPEPGIGRCCGGRYEGCSTEAGVLEHLFWPATCHLDRARLVCSQAGGSSPRMVLCDRPSSGKLPGCSRTRGRRPREESFSAAARRDIPEYPHYTRPGPSNRGWAVAGGAWSQGTTSASSSGGERAAAANEAAGRPRGPPPGSSGENGGRLGRSLPLLNSPPCRRLPPSRKPLGLFGALPSPLSMSSVIENHRGRPRQAAPRSPTFAPGPTAFKVHFQVSRGTRRPGAGVRGRRHQAPGFTGAP